MPFTHEPVYILAIIFILIGVSEWLGTRKYLKHLGSVLIVILLAAVLANLKIIPSASDAPPLYEGIFNYIGPLAIFYLLLDVRLNELRKVGLPMLFAFLLGAAGTVMGAVLGYYIFSPSTHGVPYAPAVAGMYTGTYTGGGANLTAVGIQYGVVKDGVLYAAINTVDNIITTVWLIILLALPKLLQKYFPRKKNILRNSGLEQKDDTGKGSKVRGFDLFSLLWLTILGLVALFLSNELNNLVPSISPIIFITTFSLLLAQFHFVQKLNGGALFGKIFVMIFLAVIGAYCDLGALLHSKNLAFQLLIWVSFMVTIHGLLLYIVGGIFKQDWELLSVASSANIGGATTAPVCAISLDREDLELPGILAGSIGNAIGTYLGIMIAEMLR